MIRSTTDHMTLDQINAAIDHYMAMPAGQLTPRDADRLRELRLAKRRVVGGRADGCW